MCVNGGLFVFLRTVVFVGFDLCDVFILLFGIDGIDVFLFKAFFMDAYSVPHASFLTFFIGV